MKKILALLAFVALTQVNTTFADPLLNGLATHSELGNEQFIAGLYTTTLTKSARDILIAKEEKQMQVRVLASNLSSRRFKRMWIEGMAINSSSSELERHSSNMANFSNMLKIKLVQGDIFSILRTDENVTVSLNGAKLGVIDETEFFDLLLRTWIGPVPLSSTFRGDLLAEGEMNTERLATYNGTRPTDDRILAVASALSKRVARKAKAAPPAPIVSAPAPVVASTPIIQAPKITQQIVKAPTISPTESQEPIAGEESEPPSLEEGSQIPPTIGDEPETLATGESLFDDEDEDEFTAESILAQQKYVGVLKNWSRKYLQYPAKAFRKNQQGLVRLNITIDREGRVKSVETLEESKYRALNKEAVSAAKRAEPWPKVPDELKAEEFSFFLPVLFTIKNKK